MRTINNNTKELKWKAARKYSDIGLGNNKQKYVMNNYDNDVYTIGNEIHFTAEINKVTIQKLIRQMSSLIHKHKKKSVGKPEKLSIVYVVDSRGGSVTSVLKFVDFVSLMKSKFKWVEFVSIISGLVASAGTIMSIVADKRYMTKHSHAMIHELSSDNSGKYAEMRSYMLFLNKLHDCLMSIYLEKCNKTKNELEVLLRAETWFSAEEYLEHGFVDELK